VDVRGAVYHRSGAWGIVILSVAPHRKASSGADPGGAGKPKGAAR
jgi:hypothetical protein